MNQPEFSRLFPLDQIGSVWREVTLVADDGECRALASRFALIAIHELEAKVRLRAEESYILCEGRIAASVEQQCIATGEPIPAALAHDFTVRFVPMASGEGLASEIEIEIEDYDIVEHDGRSVDVGEAVAQTLLLALDPFPRSADAETELRAAGVIGDDEVVNPAFAKLKSLLKR